MFKIKYQHKANPNDIVKIRVNLTMEQVANWADIRQEIEAWATENKFVVNTIVPIVAYEQGERQKLVRNNKKSDDQYLSAFGKRSGVDKDTMSVGKRIVDSEL